jgi:DNA-binding helix-hairpin-helix protein with protein kinase domain
MAAGKRKRGAGFSERDKFEHKSATLLQREAKKVRAFLARKAVQQLKQQQQAQQTKANEDSNAAKAAKKQQQTQKRERELATLKVGAGVSLWAGATEVLTLAWLWWSRRWT